MTRGFSHPWGDRNYKPLGIKGHMGVEQLKLSYWNDKQGLREQLVGHPDTQGALKALNEMDKGSGGHWITENGTHVFVKD